MKLDDFLRPLYQDVDGVSRAGEIERVARIARTLHESTRELELLLAFHVLGKWLDKVGNISRTLLAVEGLNERELRATAASIRRLDEPASDVERAVAAAILIDNAGVRGLAERFTRARREGQSLLDVVREVLADAWVPDWMPAAARPLLEARHEARREVCKKILDEL